MHLLRFWPAWRDVREWWFWAGCTWTSCFSSRRGFTGFLRQQNANPPSVTGLVALKTWGWIMAVIHSTRGNENDNERQILWSNYLGGCIMVSMNNVQASSPLHPSVHAMSACGTFESGWSFWVHFRRLWHPLSNHLDAQWLSSSERRFVLVSWYGFVPDASIYRLAHLPVNAPMRGN